MCTPSPVKAFRYAGRVATRVAGLHFGYSALMKDYSALHLHLEVLHIEHSPCRLTTRSKGLGKNIVGGLSVFQPLLKFRGFGL